MKTKDQLNLPLDCHYTKEHIWLKKDGDNFLVGITDYAQDQLGEIAFIELPEVGSHFETNAQFGTVESLKSVNALYMPLAASVVAVNNELEDTPTLPNVSCYGDGWILRVALDNEKDLATLLDAAAYLATLS